MAIGKYYDVYKVSTYVPRVKEIQDEFGTVGTASFISLARDKLNSQIAELRELESELYRILRVSNIDELNKRLEEFKGDVINFSGPELAEEITGILDAENAQVFRGFNSAVKEVIQNVVMTDVIPEWTEGGDAHAKVMSFLNQMKLFEGIKGVRFSSTRGFQNDRILPSQFSTHQKDYWEKILPQVKDMMQARGIKLSNVEDYIKLKQGQVKDPNNIVTWNTIIGDNRGPLKKEDAKERYPLGSPELTRINDEMTQFILDRGAVQKNELFKNIIQYVLNKDPYAFFTGRNTNDVTGVLGEIQGLYYTCCFLGISNPSEVPWLDWSAHTEIEGKKAHQDIILAGLGIQVKNTTKDANIFEHSTSFSDLNMDSFLERMGVSVYDDFYRYLEKYFGTLMFNVPYTYSKRRKKGDPYKEGEPTGKQKNTQAWKQYDAAHQDLIAFGNKINMLISVAAGLLMYMSTIDASQLFKGDVNTLYLIGGEYFKAASEILVDIRDNLETYASGFRVSAYSEKGYKNIVTALNDNQRRPNYSAEVLRLIKLKSSYVFKK